MTISQNTRDQIALCALHSFLMEVQTAMRRMRNNNLEIRIAGFVARKKHKRGLSKTTDTHIFFKVGGKADRL